MYTKNNISAIFELIKSNPNHLDFNSNETIKVLKSNFSIFLSWGSKNFRVTSDKKSLSFSVSGLKFKGLVCITYEYDLYIVSFIKSGKIVKTIKDVYVDMLVEIIDEFVEK